MKVNNKVFDMPETAHVNCVFADVDFRSAVAALKSAYKFDEHDLIGFGRDDNRKRHFILTHNHTEHMRKLDSSFENRLMDISEEFDIFWYIILDYMNGHRKHSPKNVRIEMTIKADPTDFPRYEVHILKGATKQDVVDSLQDFDFNMDYVYGQKPSESKKKGPENYQLVYAINRQRKNGKTFAQIHEEYLSGSLKNYSGSQSILSLVKFRQYYTKYKPVVPNVPI